MIFCILLGVISIILNIVDVFIFDIPYIHGNEISLIFGVIAVLAGYFYRD